MGALFPESFLWGVSTSAYQIEGSPLADGAGPSNWHRFCHPGGKGAHLAPGGDVACDHYRRWPSDIALIKGLGFQSYRFSLSWSRILPEGRGRVNQAGLDFYRRLLDGILEAGLVPLCTLFHWDLPAALEDRGGWLDRDIAGWFADYAHIAVQALPGVARWSTLNEPWVVLHDGHLMGSHPPGARNPADLPQVAHNLLRAHGLGAQACRAAGARDVGIVINLEPKHPFTDRPEDVAATRRADAYMNRQFLDPLVLGRDPEEMPEIYGPAWPEFPEADYALIRQPLDHLGINYYSRSLNVADPGAFGGWKAVPHPTHPRTDMDWEVYPPGLTETLLRVKGRYGDIPLYVNENGAAFPDPETAPPGGVRDPRRVEYFRSHLLAVADAMAKGADVRGYSAWSLLDNFEWAFGYAKRFGIVHVDYATQARTPKDSARFLSEVIASRGACLEGSSAQG